jgi:AAA+ superfamily predicted ATPase
MESMSHRPTLPLGFQLGNFPPVQKALHSDESIEVYLLEHSADSDLLLVRTLAAAMQKLMEWWSILGEDFVTESSEDLGDSTRAIRVHGRSLTGNIASLGDSQWRPLVPATMALLQTAFATQLRPSLCPALIWLSNQKPVVIPLCAAPVEGAAQADILRDFAAVLLSASTGIDMDALAANVDKLRSWNRSIPADVLDVLIGYLREADAAPATGANEAPHKNENRGLNKVAGMSVLKELLRKEIVGPLRTPEIYEKYRIGVPNGILFYGPPGCGKTYIARQLAEELGYFFQDVKPSDVASRFIHDTVVRIREMFDLALEKAPSILFIDEFDAFAPSRSELGGHQQYKSEEVNEFLANLEGCADRKVLVIAATNAPEKIDPAVRRAGRFDKLVFIPPPDAEARIAMLQFHLLDRPVEPDLDFRGVGLVLDGYSASDIRFLVEEAARAACEKAAPISTLILLDTLQRVPPSITPEDEAKFHGFQSRGT